MKKGPVSYRSHLTRVSATRNIEELAAAFKRFLHEQFAIHHGHTFTEIQDVAGRNRIHPHLKEHIRTAAQMFEEMEYRPKKPTRYELHHLRKHVHELIHASRKAYGPEEKPGNLFARVRKARKQFVKRLRAVPKPKEAIRIARTRIVEKLEEVPTPREAIRRARQRIGQKVEKLKEKRRKGEEEREMLKFALAARKQGFTPEQVESELLIMGFPKNKVDRVLKSKA